MVYLLKMVIFHGYVSHNQMVIASSYPIQYCGSSQLPVLQVAQHKGPAPPQTTFPGRVLTYRSYPHLIPGESHLLAMWLGPMSLKSIPIWISPKIYGIPNSSGQ